METAQFPDVVVVVDLVSSHRHWRRLAARPTCHEDVPIDAAAEPLHRHSNE